MSQMTFRDGFGVTDRAGLVNETLVLFTSDNGGAKLGRNDPCSKGKGQLWEGGIRVPGIVRWNGTLPAGRVSKQVAVTFDWTRTLVELANGTAPRDRRWDGINLFESLQSGQTVHRTLFSRRLKEPIRRNVDPHRAVRDGKWKYIDRPDGTEYLYDLSRDIGETSNLAETMNQRAARMQRLLDRWKSRIDPPLYDQRSASLEARRSSRRSANGP